MKRKICMIVSLLIIFTTYNLVYASTDSVKDMTKVIKVDGIDKRVNIVTIDLDDENIALKVVTANDKVQGNESFQSMINRKKPIAAINGNFFASYDTLNPYGTIIKNGEITYLEGANTSFIVMEDNQVDIDNFGSTLKGYIDRHRKNVYNNKTQSMDFYLFDVWYINTPPLDKSGVYLYNSKRGESINLPDGVVIEVIKDKVTKVIRNSGQTKIPKDGYLLYYAKDIANDKYINSRFKIGSTIELEYEFSISNPEEKPNKIETKDKEELSSKQTKLFGSIDKNTKNIWNNSKNTIEA